MIATLGADSQWMIMKSPQILHGFFAAIADFHLYKLIKQLSGFQIAKVFVCLFGLYLYLFNIEFL